MSIHSVLDEARRFWDAHARHDPLWAILTEAGKKQAWSVGRFFETGEHEIRTLLYELEVRGVRVPRRHALDFGCGAGRLSQALAGHFERVTGVDISAEMLALAASLNRFPDRVQYLRNDAPDLRLLADGSVDVVVSNIVLQHLPPEVSLGYVREFHRVCAPGGIIVFQLPSHPRGEADPAPPAIHPMPDEAYHATLIVHGIPAQALTPGQPLTLDVEVVNRGPHAWRRDAGGVLSVGNHWLSADGARMVVRDDGRAALPPVLAPGESARVALTVTAPPDAGTYQCEIDVVHEGVVWFFEKGSPTQRFAVGVGQAPVVGGDTREALSDAVSRWADVDAAMPQAPDAVAARDEFPMHGVESATVLAAIADAGGRLLFLQPDRSCGDEWVSYRYFVQRPDLA